LSTASAEPEEKGMPDHIAVVWLRRSVALLVVLALAALFRVEIAHIDDDLLLIAPEEVLAGQVFPVRVHVLRGVTRPSGPSQVRARVYVRLGDLAGHTLAEAVGDGEPDLGAALTLVVPADAHGTLRLDAWEGDAHGPPNGALRVSRAVAVVERVSPRVLPREALPLQQASVGRVVPAAPDVVPPWPLLPRVLGATCIYMEPCELAVWVGTPAAELSLEVLGGASAIADFPRGEQTGVVVAKLRVAGPEAEVVVRARRGGVPVASRTMRLPQGLGRSYVANPKLVPGPAGAEITAEIALPPLRGRGIADLFVDGAWRASTDLHMSGVHAQVAMSLAGPPGSELRLQVRSDVFESDGAGARVLLRGAEAVRAAYRAAPFDEPGGSIAQQAEVMAAVAGLEHTAEPAALAFLVSPAEDDAYATPPPARARPALVAHLEAGRLRVRWAFAAALCCAALVAGSWLGQRGLGAAREADAVMVEAGSTFPTRGRLEVALWALGVALAFVAAALLIVAKPLWF
jgi:hypothetical protein